MKIATIRNLPRFAVMQGAFAFFAVGSMVKAEDKYTLVEIGKPCTFFTATKYYVVDRGNIDTTAHGAVPNASSQEILHNRTKGGKFLVWNPPSLSVS